MKKQNARLVAIAYCREALGMKISSVAGYVGLARALGLGFKGMDKSIAVRIVTKWARNQIGGELSNNPFKKPVKAQKQSFYETREWRELRYSVLVKYGGTCQCCGASSKTGAVIHVDHIKPRSKFPELELDPSNLQVLCADCNLGKSNKDQTSWVPESFSKVADAYSDRAISKLLKEICQN